MNFYPPAAAYPLPDNGPGHANGDACRMGRRAWIGQGRQVTFRLVVDDRHNLPPQRPPLQRFYGSGAPGGIWPW